MAGLLLIAIFSTLGILQGTFAGYDSKVLERETVEYETKSYENIYLLIDNYLKYTSYLDEDAYLKDQAIGYYVEVFTIMNKCDCGKEYENKELLNALENLLRLRYFFARVYEGPVIGCINNISAEATFALDELSCCSKNDICVKKLEYPVVKYKEPIRECKADKCSTELYKLLPLAIDGMQRLITNRLLYDQCRKLYEDLYKAKDEIPKDEKCKKENVYDLIQKVQNVNLCHTKLNTYQLVLTRDVEPKLAAATASALQQMIACSKGNLKLEERKEEKKDDKKEDKKEEVIADKKDGGIVEKVVNVVEKVVDKKD